MNITKELLHYSKISSLSIPTKDGDLLCYLKKQIGNNWIISLASDDKILYDDNIFVQINFNDGYVIKINTILVRQEKEICVLKLPEKKLDKRFSEIFNNFSSMEYNDEKYGRRKEKRIKIAKMHFKEFGLSSIEQKISFGKQVFPCVIIDVSIHGICLIAPYSPLYAKEFENFLISMNFVKENSFVTLKVHKVHSRLLKTQNGSYIKLSCQILEPIHFLWREKVISMIKNIEKEADFE